MPDNLMPLCTLSQIVVDDRQFDVQTKHAIQ